MSSNYAQKIVIKMLICTKNITDFKLINNVWNPSALSSVSSMSDSATRVSTLVTVVYITDNDDDTDVDDDTDQDNSDGDTIHDDTNDDDTT